MNDLFYFVWFWKYSTLLVLCLSSFLRAWCNPAIETGEKLYAKHCAECHGENGEGVEDEFSKPLVGDWPLGKPIGYVNKTMPDYDPKLVTGKEAEAVSKFIFESFYKKPELFRTEASIQLASFNQSTIQAIYCRLILTVRRTTRSQQTCSGTERTILQRGRNEQTQEDACGEN